MYTKLALLMLIIYHNANLVHNEDVHDLNSDLYVEYVLLKDQHHPCHRPCNPNTPPMICKYNFTIEYYNTMSKACYDCPFNKTDCFRPDCIPAGGTKRLSAVINRQLPGPAIEVCQNDRIIVDVFNDLRSEGTTMHWHGQHQRKYQYMDGVPFITQCPIQPGTTFRYSFTADNVGTHFWHSHLGFQRADGAFGPMIVRQAMEDDPHSALYDHDLADHTIIIIDWDPEPGLDKFVAHHHNDGDNKPATILINGLGRFKQFNTEDNETITTPIARFFVEKNLRYRFRIINAGFLNCPIEMSIDNHTFSVISSDGYDFEPSPTTSLVTYAGERFDIVLHANQSEDLYWIRFRGLMDCDERFTKAFQLAVLEYNRENSSRYDLPLEEPTWDEEPSGKQINSLNVGTEDQSNMKVSITKMESLVDWEASLKLKPDYQFYVGYDFYKKDNPHFHKAQEYGFYNVTNTKKRLLTPQLNHISMKIPSFPLLSQRDQIDDRIFCNSSTIGNCTNSYCECPHVLQVSLNSIVEMVLVDEGLAFDANHPLHLHGHAFRVVAMERMGRNITIPEVKKWDQLGKIKRNLIDAPLKDTVTIPDGGYTIIRFNASNPGYWLFHCHIEYHAEIGMALVVKVGDHKQMPPVPKYFPICGDYLPDLSQENKQEKCVAKTFLEKLWELKFEDCPNQSLILQPTILLIILSAILTAH